MGTRGPCTGPCSCPWRLPGELEWEKAARGVDGRWYPCGDTSDASWCCMRDSHRGRQLPAEVGAFPRDESVYGVRGAGGNVRDRCLDPWAREGPPTVDHRVQPPETPARVDLSPGVRRACRGGSFYSIMRYARCANRTGVDTAFRDSALGFRLFRRL